MPNIPTPIRAALGLAATAVDEARKLPETLPQAVTTVPLMAVSTAMQASMKVQQHLATLAARGDEVLSQLRGSSAEPPSWATFDEDPPAAGTGSIAADPQSAKAAFDLIDYDTGFAEGLDDDGGKGRWDAVGVGGTEAQPDPIGDAGLSDAGLSVGDLNAGDGFDVTATPPSAAGPTPPAPDLADAVSAPDPAPAKAARTGAGKAGPTKAAKKAPGKTSPAKTSPANAGPAKANAAKAGPAKAAKRAARKEPDHEPLEVAARKAKPSPTPNPATMAAEILQAHEAAADDE
ncbi:MAG TPA: hypothetical protein VF557_16855 [Jatrophihabitans sp.]|jgi:hypothetical protein|uniref:hypothetical protein n=1 Tax=Jatrophihabitans sp. TaxID=1932789 RepID=UPI002F064072